MITKRVLNPDRIRKVGKGFSFIPHRFLTDGFLAALEQPEILLYLFLVMASDRYGLSFYSYDGICHFLKLDLDQYVRAKHGLIKKNLIAFDGTVFQVLELPPEPATVKKPCQSLTSSPLGELADKMFKEV